MPSSNNDEVLDVEQLRMDLAESNLMIKNMADAIAARDAARETEKRLKQQLRSATYHRKCAEEKYDTLVLTCRRLCRTDSP